MKKNKGNRKKRNERPEDNQKKIPEALAIIDALKKWKHYFAATSLTIRTDQLAFYPQKNIS